MDQVRNSMCSAITRGRGNELQIQVPFRVKKCSLFPMVNILMPKIQIREFIPEKSRSICSALEVATLNIDASPT